MIPAARAVTQATTALAQKPDLLALAQKSGCVGVLIGFESLSQDSLREADKRYKAHTYGEIIRKLHDHGIGVEGTFIFGFDQDDPGVFERTADDMRTITSESFAVGNCKSSG